MPAQLELRTTTGRGMLLATVVASGMAFLDGTVVNVALPHIGADLHASLAGLQWTVTGYTLTLAAFVLLGGALGDRYGRRRIFLLGVVWFTAASALCGLAQSIEWLVAGRVVQGVGAALLVPGSLALIEASYRSEDRGRAIGAWSGLSGVSTVVGPFLGGWLIDVLSWRWIFFINVPLALVVLAASRRWVPESSSPSDARFDVVGAVLGVLGLAGVTYALVEGSSGGPALWVGLGGLLALVAFVLVERRLGPDAMMNPALFSSARFTALNIYTLAVYAALSGMGFFLVVYLQTVVGFSAIAAGATILPVSLLLLVGSAQAGALATRIGPRIPLAVGPLVCATGLLLLRTVGPGASFWTDVLPGSVLFGLGLTLIVAPLTASVLAAVADRYAGIASGVNNAAARAASLLAVAALPLLVGLSGNEYTRAEPLTHAFRAAMLWCVGLLLAGTVLALLSPLSKLDKKPTG
jgi:EmrB/QacA subfamily drug resistance transporter